LLLGHPNLAAHARKFEAQAAAAQPSLANWLQGATGLDPSDRVVSRSAPAAPPRSFELDVNDVRYAFVRDVVCVLTGGEAHA